MADTLPHRLRRTHIQHRALPTSLFREESAPFPVSHTPVATISESDNSKTHNIGRASEITRSRCRCSGTRGRDPQWAWYHRSFLFSQWPILARHSSTPFGGIFEGTSPIVSRAWPARLLLQRSTTQHTRGVASESQTPPPYIPVLLYLLGIYSAWISGWQATCSGEDGEKQQGVEFSDCFALLPFACTYLRLQSEVGQHELYMSLS